MNGIGSHTLPNRGATVTWLTPKPIIDALGGAKSFDLDPCAAPSPRPWATATKHIELPDDGLCALWEGRVWCNPPYDRSTDEWLRRLSGHRHGTALIFARTETETWHRWVWKQATAILFLEGRLHFHYTDGARAKGNAGGPSALVAYSAVDANYLRLSKLAGHLVWPRVQ